MLRKLAMDESQDKETGDVVVLSRRMTWRVGEEEEKLGLFG